MPTAAMGPAFAISVIGLGYFVAVAVQLTKFAVKALPVSADNQNSLVRLYVFVVAIATVLVVDWLSYHLASRQDILSAVADGLSVAIAAITVYHVLGPDALPAPPVLLQGLSAPEAAEPVVETP